MIMKTNKVQFLQVRENQERFFVQQKSKIDYMSVAEAITKDRTLIFCGNDFYEFQDGYYKTIGFLEIRKIIKDLLQGSYSSRCAKEIIEHIKLDTQKPVDELNKSELLNLKNGLFNLKTDKLEEHTSENLSTIRLDVKYNPEADCPKWKKTLNEIFQDDEGKIKILQEFFGLCLTRETKHRKALFCWGTGANGKSTVLDILSSLISKKNCSYIPLDKFNDTHYTINLFGKLVNISDETKVKSEVYDSIFKSVVAGDSITADSKFQQPIAFKPFCKLVFAVNSLPRTEDKANAFYDRLLILKFEKCFSEKERNKKLSEELVQELDGIFLWALEGLKRLKEQGSFTEHSQVTQEIDGYRKDNNNVLVFIDEECCLNSINEISKNALYLAYKAWCDNSGYKGLSKNRFGNELKEQFPKIEEDRNSNERFWKGVSLK